MDYSPKTVKLNVGGKHYEVSRDLIEGSSSMLEELVSDKWNDDPDEEVFVDRSGIVFEQVLGYLRYGSVELPTCVSREAFRRDMDYYCLECDDEAIRDGDAIIAELRDQNKILIEKNKRLKNNVRAWIKWKKQMIDGLSSLSMV